MATTPEDSKTQDQQYAEAFNEDVQPAPEQTEDEAFGLVPPGAGDEEPGDTATSSAPAVSVVIEGAPSGEGQGENVQPTEPVETGEGREGGRESGTATGDDTASTAPAGDDLEKERQRLRSWEGRLRAQQADIDARREETPAEEAAETPAEEAAEGKPSLQEAVEKLSADFGDEFVGLIQAIARGEASKVAGDHVAALGQSVEEIINDINDSKTKNHFEKIFDAHPDFMDLAESPEFQGWIGEDKGRQEIVARGSARQVIKLLNDYKESKAEKPATQEQTGATQDESAIDAAEGVRSGGAGMQLPTAPGMQDGYAEAWERA